MYFISVPLLREFLEFQEGANQQHRFTTLVLLLFSKWKYYRKVT